MSATVFDMLGGEEGLRILVDRFYHHMDTRPDAKHIRDMHPADLSSSKDKLWRFLVGRFGGPNLYMEKYGHPRLRARHFPFAIGDEEALAWVVCMQAALEEQVPDPGLRNELLAFFSQVAQFMKNQPE
ncbi:MAG: group II truncated hemoglobin [Myxococcota bacterium]|nr:group II truncated hemoglobin [Myxococcota bacterium]